MTEKVIKRGYVKWTDEDGVFHKEPLADHPEMLAKATPEQQLTAEETRRLNDAAEKSTREAEEDAEDDVKETLQELKKAPADILTAAQLDEPAVVTESAPAAGPEEPAVEDHHDEDHDLALQELREKTA